MQLVADALAGPLGPLLIFLLRVVDVSMATVRTLLVVRNAKALVASIGFVEVLIWIIAVGTAIQNLNSPLHILAYSAGFATGNVVGLWLEERIALGFASVRAVVGRDARRLASELRSEGFATTEFPGWGHEGRVRLVYSVVPRRHVVDALNAIESREPGAFVVVDEPRQIRRGQMFQKRRK